MSAELIKAILEEYGFSHAEMCLEEALSQFGSEDNGVIEAKLYLKEIK